MISACVPFSSFLELILLTASMDPATTESRSTSTSELVSLQSTPDNSSVSQSLSPLLHTMSDKTSLLSLLPSTASYSSMKKAASSSDLGTATFAAPLDVPSFFGLGQSFFRWPSSSQFQQTPFGLCGRLPLEFELDPMG